MNWKCEINDTKRSLEEDVNFEYKLNYGHFENDFKNGSFKKSYDKLWNYNKYQDILKNWELFICFIFIK
jgi:hypothetical protein